MSLVISDKYQYIFFHLPKNAGVSISSFLIKQEKFLIIKKYINYITPYILGKKNNFYISKNLRFYKFNSHITCYDFYKIFEKDLFNNYYKFAVVRNPFDRAVSRYEYSKKINKKFKSFKFEDFLKFDLKNNLPILKQYEFCTNDKKNLAVNKIIKFEELNKELKEISYKLFQKEHSIKHLNKTPRNNYREYFNFKTINLLKEKLNHDLIYFDYSF